MKSWSACHTAHLAYILHTDILSQQQAPLRHDATAAAHQARISSSSAN
jgi:hypothetical protein